jgi:hypothetical protein
MRYRKLRIAWSVGCGIACVLLIVLWVRSYLNYEDAMWRSATDSLCVHSGLGHVLVVEQPGNKPQYAFPMWKWTVGSQPITDPVNLERDIMNYHKTLGFGWGEIAPQRFLMAPHWSLILLSSVMSGLPWLRSFAWRFSLRTLLIATTLVAVVLGLIVWLR